MSLDELNENEIKFLLNKKILVESLSRGLQLATLVDYSLDYDGEKIIFVSFDDKAVMWTNMNKSYILKEMGELLYA